MISSTARRWCDGYISLIVVYIMRTTGAPATIFCFFPSHLLYLSYFCGFLHFVTRIRGHNVKHWRRSPILLVFCCLGVAGPAGSVQGRLGTRVPKAMDVFSLLEKTNWSSLVRQI